MVDNTETPTLNEEEKTSNKRGRLTVINSSDNSDNNSNDNLDDNSEENSSTNTSVKRGRLNVINAGGEKESVYSKDKEGGPVSLLLCFPLPLL